MVILQFMSLHDALKEAIKIYNSCLLTKSCRNSTFNQMEKNRWSYRKMVIVRTISDVLKEMMDNKIGDYIKLNYQWNCYIELQSHNPLQLRKV